MQFWIVLPVATSFSTTFLVSVRRSLRRRRWAEFAMRLRSIPGTSMPQSKDGKSTPGKEQCAPQLASTSIQWRCPMANDSEDEVGYKKPPKASRFQKGRSGNPSGRRRKAPGITELLAKIAEQKVLTHGKNGPKSMSKIKAILTQLANQAASGDLKAAKTFTELLIRFPELAKQENMKAMETNVKEKLLAALERHERDENNEG